MSTPAPSFEQAIEITAQWLRLWEEGELSDEVLADRVAELVASRAVSYTHLRAHETDS